MPRLTHPGVALLKIPFFGAKQGPVGGGGGVDAVHVLHWCLQLTTLMGRWFPLTLKCILRTLFSAVASCFLRLKCPYKPSVAKQGYETPTAGEKSDKGRAVEVKPPGE